MFSMTGRSVRDRVFQCRNKPSLARAFPPVARRPAEVGGTMGSGSVPLVNAKPAA